MNLKDISIIVGAIVSAIFAYLYQKRGEKLGALYYDNMSSKYIEEIAKLKEKSDELKIGMDINKYRDLRDKYLKSREQYERRTSKKV